MRLAELQQVAVFAQFGDESQITEQQPVCSLLVLLLLDLDDTQVNKNALHTYKPVAEDGAQVSIYVFVVVGVDLFLQQRQQVVKATGKPLLLHLHKQAADLSAETSQARLRGWWEKQLLYVLMLKT